MEYRKAEKLFHPKYGVCYYFGKASSGLAIVEVYKNGKFVDRFPVKFSNLEFAD